MMKSVGNCTILFNSKTEVLLGLTCTYSWHCKGTIKAFSDEGNPWHIHLGKTNDFNVAEQLPLNSET